MKVTWCKQSNGSSCCLQGVCVAETHSFVSGEAAPCGLGIMSTRILCWGNKLDLSLNWHTKHTKTCKMWGKGKAGGMKNRMMRDTKKKHNELNQTNDCFAPSLTKLRSKLRSNRNWPPVFYCRAPPQSPPKDPPPTTNMLSVTIPFGPSLFCNRF